MSAEFSRRSFLKYTALTAVVVAGSGLLTGCSGENPVLYEVPSTNRVLKVKCTMNSAVYDADSQTAVFELEVVNGRVNALNITYKNFAVTAPSYYANYSNGKLRITSDTGDVQIKHGGTITYTVTVTGLKLEDADKVRFTFYPDIPEYTEYSANWELTADQMKKTVTPEPGETTDSEDAEN